ncbi:MAG TPA: DsrE family protein [Symbiobacteriaceae bacterium]|nr:DsrE family protein [Symbiobacteriaceae bacterium]
MKYLYMQTNGPETPAKAAMPFQLAAAATMVGNDATVVLSALGCNLVKKGVPDELVIAPDMPRLRHFIDLARECGVQILVCSGGLDVTGLKPDDLMPELDGIIGGMTFNEMAGESDVVMIF